jgi:hypothetical protein
MSFPKRKSLGKEVDQLRKVMLLAAMLAMALAAAAPAFAQNAEGGDVAILQYSCNQIQAAVNTQYQQGEGTGAVAGAAQSLGIDQQQVLACFGTAAGFQESPINVNVNPSKAAKGSAKAAKAAKGSAKAAKATAAPGGGAAGGGAAGGGAAGGGGGGMAAAAAGGKLPPTGGVSPLALGAAVLLVGGGLLARRILR